MESIGPATNETSTHSETATLTVNDSHLYYPPLENGQSAAKPNVEERPVHSDKLYVGNLPSEISLVDLHKIFKKYGQVSDIQLPYNTGPGGKPKGYAFILYANKEDAAKAQLKMDGAILGKRIIRVDFAHQEMKSNMLSKSRKTTKETGQVTSLSIMKSGHHGRNTREQIALAEAKLRQLSGDNPSYHTTTSSSYPSSLPPKPQPTLPIQSILGSSTPSISSSSSKSSLPSLPLPPQLKPQVASPVYKSVASVVPTTSSSTAPVTKKTHKLSGIKIIRKPKDGV